MESDALGPPEPHAYQALPSVPPRAAFPTPAHPVRKVVHTHPHTHHVGVVLAQRHHPAAVPPCPGHRATEPQSQGPNPTTLLGLGGPAGASRPPEPHAHASRHSLPQLLRANPLVLSSPPLSSLHLPRPYLSGAIIMLHNARP